MDPEEMDVVELVEDVPVDPSWRVTPDSDVEVLHEGERGMVIHRGGEDAAVYDVEFVDDATKEPRVLAKLRSSQMRVVERYTLEPE